MLTFDAHIKPAPIGITGERFEQASNASSSNRVSAWRNNSHSVLACRAPSFICLARPLVTSAGDHKVHVRFQKSHLHCRHQPQSAQRPDSEQTAALLAYRAGCASFSTGMMIESEGFKEPAAPVRRRHSTPNRNQTIQS